MEVAAQPSPLTPSEQSSAVSNPRQILRIPKPKPKAAINDVGWNHIDRTKPEPLEKRFADVKASLIKPENYAIVQASWDRLTKALQERVSEIESSGSNAIPTFDFSEIGPDGRFSAEVTEKIKKSGCCLLKNVVSEEQALTWKKELLDYCTHRHPDIPIIPAETPVLYKAYWTPTQTEMRSHPNMIAAQIAMSRLYHCSPEDEIDINSQAMYADRFRVRTPGFTMTLPPHLDNGGVEKWENKEYSETFRAILEGRWEEYDPWNISYRAEALVDMYGGSGSYSAFRSIQGWLSLSNNGPTKGTLTLLPDLRLATAYIILRPFFDDNDQLDMESTYFYGAQPGRTHLLKDDWYPVLKIPQTLVSVPEAPPGSYVFWHCDIVHSIEHTHNGNEDASVAYIPVVPLCAYNIANLVDQKKAFLAGATPPDFPASIDETDESLHEDRGQPKHIVTLEGKRMLGLEPFDVDEQGITPGARKIRQYANEQLGF